VTESDRSPVVLRGRRPSSAPARPPLPARLRVARVAELACLPVLGIMLLSLPVPHHFSELVAVAIIALECISTVVVAVGFARRRRWAAVVAVALAGWLIVAGIARLPLTLSALGGFGRFAFLGALVVGGWVLLMQLVVLLALASPRLWRDELR
jgi:hypothetical protein